MFKGYEENRPLEAVTITIDSDPATDLTLGTTNFAYKVFGDVYNALSVTPTALLLDTAFAASTKYYQGQVIFQGGKYYEAKTTFTSAAAFAAGDWNDMGTATLYEGEYRFYGVYVYNDPADGDFKACVVPGKVSEMGAYNAMNIVDTDIADFNANRGPLQAALLAWVIVYNDTSTPFVPGTNDLVANTNCKIVGMFGNVGS